MTSWQQDRRRAASRQFTSDNARALASLVGGLGDARDMLLDDEERKRKAEADKADQDLKGGLLRARTDAAKTSAESGLLKAKAEEAASQEKLLRTKSESEEKSARLTREAAADEAKARPQKVASAATDVESEISMPGGVSQTQLEQIAVSRGLPASDWRAVLNERDANVDKVNREAAEVANLSAQTEQREADAEKKRRVPTPKAPAPPKNQTIQATPLRKEFNALPSVKAAADSSANFDTMTNASKDPSAAGDLALIFTFMKILDPGSVVKETEFANAQNAAGVDDRVRNAWNRTLSGERLSAAQRADFLRQAQGLRDQAVARANADVQRYSELATRSGLDPADVVGQLRNTAPSSPPSAAPAPSAKVRVSNGQEILEIDRADLGDALADGYKVVR